METYIGYWKQKLDIGNIKRRLETQFVYWKHTSDIGNIELDIGNNAFGNIRMIMKIIRLNSANFGSQIKHTVQTEIIRSAN